MAKRLFFVSHAVLWALLIALVISASQAHASGRPVGHAVSLSQARSAPTYLTYLWPHGSVTYARGSDGHNCQHGGYFSDVSAYTWKGTQLSDQYWSKRGLFYFWRDDKGKRVTFDGITFRNHTRGRVLVAAWCEK